MNVLSTFAMVTLGLTSSLQVTDRLVWALSDRKKWRTSLSFSVAEMFLTFKTLFAHYHLMINSFPASCDMAGFSQIPWCIPFLKRA